jgi:hypothetical protein
MSLSSLQVVDIIEVMENFMEKKRLPETSRPKVDIKYEIDDQSVVIYELRRPSDKPGEMSEHGVAKATFVKSSNEWKVFCLESDLKWHAYQPHPRVKSLNEFVGLVQQDSHGCFWG